ncbi:MAG: DUF4097 family beta strand repeat-containing protein [Acidobacteriota bacterium]
MSRMIRLRNVGLSLLITCAVSLAASAQTVEKSLNCNDRGRSDRGSHCLIKEQAIAATGALTVDGKKNGGVSVKGWERNEVLVRMQIQAWAQTDSEAQALTGQIRVETGGGNIHAEGPEAQNREGWSVSYEIFAPYNSNLSLKTHNGGISVSNIRGQIQFDAHNGGVALKHLAGNVKGETHNGGVSIELAGNRWDGEGMDVKTTNGGISLRVPENYSAQLETGTVNGRVSVDFPLTVQGEIKRELSVNLGNGGAKIRATTTNGGVSLKRKA